MERIGLGMEVVGKAAPRIDARSKVDGSAHYADDLSFGGMLHAAVARSEHAHAELLSLDTERARTVPGVEAVLSARDIPGENLIPLIIPDLPVLADRRVRFVGEPIAVVAAETREAAEEAARLVRASYRPLPAVFDAREAMRDGAPRIHERGNVFRYIPLRKGDVAKGFAEADLIVEGEFTTPYQEHAYLETQGVICVPEADGCYSLYGSVQCPFYVHDALVRVLGVPHHRIRVVQAAVGGGFGGKEDVPSILAGLAAIAARATRRPVKLIYGRKEDIETMSKRHPSHTRIRIGAKSDGRLVACEVEYVLDGGAYATLSPVVLFRGVAHAAGPYEIPHVKVDGYAVATNKVPSGAFRGFGSPQVIFAHESLYDELAERLGIDPVEFRRRNALAIGKRTATGQLITESAGLTDCLDTVERESGWKEKRRGGALRPRPHDGGGARRYGIGVSAIAYGVGLGARGAAHDKAGAVVKLYPDHSVHVAVGNTEMGQGMRTVISQIAAEALGLPLESVITIDADTSRVPDSGPTVASRTTLMSGRAVLDACDRIRGRIFSVASSLLEAPANELAIANGRVAWKGAPERSLALDEVLAEFFRRRENPAAEGYTVSPACSFDEHTGQGDAYICYSFAANVAEVEVDIETGETRVLRITTAHDIGRAINPQTAEGQIEGGVLQGIGFALVEECLWDSAGRIVNPRLSTYVIPTAADAPEIRVFIREHPFSGGPFGAKGLGEMPLMGVAPAVINAIADAAGVRVRDLPATPERIRSLLREKGKREPAAAPVEKGTRPSAPGKEGA